MEGVNHAAHPICMQSMVPPLCAQLEALEFAAEGHSGMDAGSDGPSSSRDDAADANSTDTGS